MGRFYKTATPEFVDDIIYQPPWELMKEVIQTHDKRITKGDEELDAFSTTVAGLENLKTDDPAVQEKIDEYRSQADDISSKMHGDITNYSKYLPEIANAKKTLTREMNTGLLGRAAENFAAEQEDTERLMGIKDADPGIVSGLIKKRKTEFEEKGGTNYQDATTYNKYASDLVLPEEQVDEMPLIASIKDQINADQSSWSSARPTEGGYIKTEFGTTKFIKEGKVKKVLEGTPGLDKWKRGQRQRIELQGFNELGKRGQDLKDYTDLVLANKTEELIKQATGAISYTERSSRTSLKGDSVVAAAKRNVNNDSTTPFAITADRRTDAEKIQTTNTLDLVRAALEEEGEEKGMSEKDVFLKMGSLKANGLLKEFASRNNLSQTRLNSTVGIGDKVGVRTNIVSPPEGGWPTPQAKAKASREAALIIQKMQELSPAQQVKMVVSSNYSEGSSLDRKSILNIFNSESVSAANLGGKQVQGEQSVIAPPGRREILAEENMFGWETKEAGFADAWYDTRGGTIRFADDSYPTNEEDAVTAAQETGVAIKTNKKLAYKNVLGNQIAVVGSKVSRYVSNTGNVDNLEMEVTTSRIDSKTGKPVVEVTVISVPKSLIKIGDDAIQ